MKRGFVLLLFLSFFLTACGGGKFAKDKTFSAFKTVDLNGNEVTERIFAEKDVTMIHFWGSTCGPCLDELPDLQEIYRKLPENVNMVGILADVPIGHESGIERARTALAEIGADFQNLLLDEALTEYASDLSLTPFTLFVNREGKILETVKGAAKLGYLDHFKNLVPDLKWKDE